MRQVSQDVKPFKDDISLAVMKMSAFVNIKNHKLFDLKQFTNVFSSFLKNSEEKENHFIGTWRQDLAA